MVRRTQSVRRVQAVFNRDDLHDYLLSQWWGAGSSDLLKTSRAVEKEGFGIAAERLGMICSRSVVNSSASNSSGIKQRIRLEVMTATVCSRANFSVAFENVLRRSKIKLTRARPKKDNGLIPTAAFKRVALPNFGARSNGFQRWARDTPSAGHGKSYAPA